jgi:hypothetical protein
MANIARLLDTNQRKNFGSQIHGRVRGHTVATASSNYYKAGGNRSSLATLQAGRSTNNAGNIGKAPFNNGFAPIKSVTVHGKPNVHSNARSTNLIRTFNLPGGHTATSGTTVGGLKITKGARIINGNIAKTVFNVTPSTYTWDQANDFNGVQDIWTRGTGGDAPDFNNVGGPADAAGVGGAGSTSYATGNILPNRLNFSMASNGVLPGSAPAPIIDSQIENNGSMVGDVGSAQVNSSSKIPGILGWPGSQVPAFTEADIYGQEVESSHVSQSFRGTATRAALGSTGTKKDVISSGTASLFTRAGKVTANGTGPGQVTAGRANDPSSLFVPTVITGMPSVSDPTQGQTTTGQVGLWGSLRSNGNTGPGNQSNGLLKSRHVSNFVVSDVEELDYLVTTSQTSTRAKVDGDWLEVMFPSSDAGVQGIVGAAYDELTSDTAIFPGR